MITPDGTWSVELARFTNVRTQASRPMGPRPQGITAPGDYLIIRRRGYVWATIPARPWAEAEAKAIDIIGGPEVWATLAEK